MQKSFIERAIIENSQNLLMSPKPDKGYRVSIDYRLLNLITKDNIYPMLDISLILANLCGCRVFTKLDLKDGYYHVPMEKESEKHTELTREY
jgi:Reverse transcriptase (RNA-dependent DNA polymerase)